VESIGYSGTARLVQSNFIWTKYLIVPLLLLLHWSVWAVEVVTVESVVGMERIIYYFPGGALEQRESHQYPHSFRLNTEVIAYSGPWYEPDANQPYTGPVFVNYNDGSLHIKASMKKGLLSGLYQRWYENGQLREKSEFRKGGYIGEKIEWYPNGLVSSHYYRDSNFSGVLTAFYEDGEKKSADTYLNGTIVHSRRWRIGGELHEEFSLDDSGLRVSTSWYRGNQIRSRSSYRITDSGNRVLDGEQRAWFPNGQLEKIDHYTQGTLEGISESYDETGVVVYSREYKSGKVVASFPLELEEVELPVHDFRGTNLYRAKLGDSDFSDSDFSGSNLRYAELQGTVLVGANLRYADLRGADLSDADLSYADLTGAILIGANLTGATLDHSNFDKAQLSFSMMKNITGGKANFSHAVLINADLTEATISHSDFSESDLSFAIVKDAELLDCNFGHASFRQAIFSETNLNDSTFDTTDFSKAVIHNTIAEYGNFRSSDFSATNILGFFVPGGDFSDTKGLSFEMVYNGFYYGFPPDMEGGPFGKPYKEGGAIWHVTGGSRHPGRNNLPGVVGIPEIVQRTNQAIHELLLSAFAEAVADTTLETLAQVNEIINRRVSSYISGKVDYALRQAIENVENMADSADSDGTGSLGRRIASADPVILRERWPETQLFFNSRPLIPDNYNSKYNDSVWFYRGASSGYSDVFRLREYLQYRVDVKARQSNIIETYKKVFKIEPMAAFGYRLSSKAHMRGALDLRSKHLSGANRFNQAVELSKAFSQSIPHRVIVEELYWVEKKKYVRNVPTLILERNRTRKNDVVVSLTERPGATTDEIPGNDATIIQINTVINNGVVVNYTHADGQIRDFQIVLKPRASATHTHVQPQPPLPLPDDIRRVEMGEKY